MNIADYIPYGRGNAVTNSYLGSLLGLSRPIRISIVQDARKNGEPIISDNVNGYYMATCQHDIDMFYNSMRHRALEVFKTARAVKNIKLNERIS